MDSAARLPEVGYRMNKWIQRLLAPGIVIAVFTMFYFEFKLWQIIAILLPTFGALTLLMMFVAPGPRTERFVESLKTRFR